VPNRYLLIVRKFVTIILLFFELLKGLRDLDATLPMRLLLQFTRQDNAFSFPCSIIKINLHILYHV